MPIKEEKISSILQSMSLVKALKVSNKFFLNERVI